MFTQEDETNQMKIEASICHHLNELYKLLLASDRIEAEEQLGFVAQWKDFWEGRIPVITREDIIQLADDLGKYISEDEINYILKDYSGWQSSRPEDNWSLVLEDMIYFVKDHPNVVFDKN